MGAVLGRIKEETPVHKVIRTGSIYEVREYEPMIAAVFRGNKSDDSGKMMGSTGFFALAGYYGITSKPQQEKAKEEAIAMTAPVLLTFNSEALGDASTSQPKDSWNSQMETMSFILPRKYPTIEDAPKPTDPRVTLELLPSSTAAVVTFNGNLNQETIRRNVQLLKDALSADGVTVLDAQPRIAGYNAPFVLPWLKTNEIQITIDPATLPSEPIQQVSES